MIYLYLAYKVAIAKGDHLLTVEHLEAVEQTTIGYEDGDRVEAIVTDTPGRRIRKLA